MGFLCVFIRGISSRTANRVSSEFGAHFYCDLNTGWHSAIEISRDLRARELRVVLRGQTPGPLVPPLASTGSSEGPWPWESNLL